MISRRRLRPHPRLRQSPLTRCSPEAAGFECSGGAVCAITSPLDHSATVKYTSVHLMRIFLVIYNADRNDEVRQAFERMQIELYPLPDKGRGRGKGARVQQDRQVWTGTKAMVVLAVTQEKQSSLFKALQEINRTYRDAQVRAFAFEAEELL